MTTLQQVELGVLGPLRVRQHGLPAADPGAKPRAILTMPGRHGGSEKTRQLEAAIVTQDTALEVTVSQRLAALVRFHELGRST